MICAKHFNLVFWAGNQWWMSYKELVDDGELTGWHIAVPLDREGPVMFIEEEGIYYD